jgi:anti-sigma B factor antagonist
VPILGVAPAGFEGDKAVELRLETRDEGEWTVLDVVGEIDLSTAPALRTRIDTLIHEGARGLVVNLERVAFLDSSGLSALIAAMKAMQAAGGRLAIACSREPVLKVFAVTGTDRVFTIRGSVAEATAA